MWWLLLWLWTNWYDWFLFIFHKIFRWCWRKFWTYAGCKFTNIRGIRWLVYILVVSSAFEITEKEVFREKRKWRTRTEEFSLKQFLKNTWKKRASIEIIEEYFKQVIKFKSLAVGKCQTPTSEKKNHSTHMSLLRHHFFRKCCWFRWFKIIKLDNFNLIDIRFNCVESGVIFYKNCNH